MKNVICSFLLLSLFVINLTGQSLENVDSKGLQELLLQINDSDIKNQKEINEFLSRKSQSEIKRHNTLVESGCTPVEIVNDRIIYKKPFNEDAAIAMGIPSVRLAGNLGINLQGEDMKIGFWDGGLVRTTHQEFQGRIQYFDGASATQFSDHATGVAGTLLATGVSADDRGMAPLATGIAYDFNGDTREMVEAQMQHVITVSNHSYGRVAGWNDGSWEGDTSISDEEDYKFGFYDSNAKTWDDIAFNAPYYLPVKSAGNDRGDSGNGPFPSDGPYDCVSSASTAKNIMVVGAIAKSTNGYDNPQNIVMSSFSGWGPTDDGRIKPDIVGVGVNVSTAAADENDDYQTTSGTSFSGPAVCGGLALLQELHQDRFNGFMTAASLKALAIHTVTQTGIEGPDYRFGWGLLNVERAAEFLLTLDNDSRRIVESTLQENDKIEYQITPKAGTDIEVTIVWTDPSGTPVPISLDPEQLMLVNDLDIRISDEAGDTFFPYILDPATPNASATTGDNFRDNVEKIFVQGAEERTYNITIEHKNSLSGGAQNFSLVLEYESSDNDFNNIYWIGGTGNWSDPSNWSLTSGGNSTGEIPDANYRVVIDNNSIQNNDVITMNENFDIASISLFTDRDVELNLNSNTLTVSGNTILSSPNLLLSNGTIAFNDPNNSEHTINFNETNTSELTIQLSEDNLSQWNIINSSFEIDNINVNNGILRIENSQLEFKNLSTTNNGSNTEIAIINSELSPSSSVSISDNTNFTASNVNWIVMDASEVNLNFGNSLGTIDFLMLENAESVTFISDQIINVLSLSNSDLTITNDISVFNLSLESGNNLSIESSELLVLSTFGIANDQEVVSINGDGNINIDFRDKLCFDYLDINGIDLSGKSSVSIGENSTIADASGWFETSCNNLLFADYTADYLCEDGITTFVDISQGPVSSRNWFVDGTLESQEEVFEFTFDNQGLYNVTLEVIDDNGQASDYSLDVEVKSNPLDLNQIVESTPTTLASLKSADTYQWLWYGNVVEGETARTYVYNGEPGIYHVVTFEDGCNRLSAIFDLGTSVLDVDDFPNLINIFPVPVIETINIELSNEVSNSIISCDLSNSKGQLIRNININRGNISKVNLGDLSPGTYLIRFNIDQDIYIKKIIVL